METNQLLWGLIVLLTGIFICSYGSVLFRIVLGFIGFAVGFSAVMWLGGFLGEALQIVVALVVGGILAAVFYLAFKFALYFAGGILGLVLMTALLGLFKIVGANFGIFGALLALAAAGVGAFFGPRLGNILFVIATSLAGAYFVVLGLAALFSISADTDQPLALLGVAFPLVLFLTVALISGLAQYQAFSVRQRFLR